MAGHKINPYIVLDFETGGFSGSKNAVTEVAMLAIDGVSLAELGKYESYIQPYLYEYDKAALDYTGITLDKLKNEGKPLLQVGQEMFQFIKDVHQRTTNTHTKKPIIVGHNVKFDLAFLQQIAVETKHDYSKFFEGKLDFYGKYQIEYIDTMVLTKLAYGHDESMTSHTLTNSLVKAGVSVGDMHKAINDVIATKELLIKYVNKLRSNFDGSGASNNIRHRDTFQFQI